MSQEFSFGTVESGPEKGDRKKEVASRGFASNFGVAFAANFGAMGMMAGLTLVLPKFLDEVNYGYWQLSVFYCLYAGYLTFGIAEGLYLRFGGRTFEDLDPKLVASHLVALQALLSGTAVGTVAATVFFVSDEARRAVIYVTVAATFFYLSRSFFTTVLQAVGRLDVYARSLLLERVLLIVACGILLAMGEREFLPFILADLATKAIGFLYTICVARHVAFRGLLPWLDAFREILTSFRGGIFVIVASISAVLVTGVVRFQIEVGFGIVAFAHVAIAFSLANMFQSVIASASMAAFPALKSMQQERYSYVYCSSHRLISPFLLLLLMAFLPLAWLLEWWLPSYEASVTYLAAMFPMVIFETKSRVLATPMLNALRREKLTTIVNLFVLLLAFFLTWYTVYVQEDILLATLSVTVLLAIRSLLLEFSVARVLGTRIPSSFLVDLVTVALFIWLFCFDMTFQWQVIFFGALLLWSLITGARSVRDFRSLGGGK